MDPEFFHPAETVPVVPLAIDAGNKVHFDLEGLLVPS
jgi:hypothetical protein